MSPAPDALSLLDQALLRKEPASAHAALIAEHGARWALAGEPLWPLHHAASMGVLDWVAALAAVCDLGARDRHGLTPLMHAAAMGHAECVSALLAHGGAPMALAKEGASALSHAASNGQAECARRLAPACDLAALEASARSPLRSAASAGETELVRLLLQWGSDPRRAAADGQTALIAAAIEGRAECVAALIPVSDLGAATGRGATALRWALAQRHFACADLLACAMGGEEMRRAVRLEGPERLPRSCAAAEAEELREAARGAASPPARPSGRL
jgi:ankyrin repeat protein